MERHGQIREDRTDGDYMDKIREDMTVWRDMAQIREDMRFYQTWTDQGGQEI